MKCTVLLVNFYLLFYVSFNIHEHTHKTTRDDWNFETNSFVCSSHGATISAFHTQVRALRSLFFVFVFAWGCDQMPFIRLPLHTIWSYIKQVSFVVTNRELKMHRGQYVCVTQQFTHILYVHIQPSIFRRAFTACNYGALQITLPPPYTRKLHSFIQQRRSFFSVVVVVVPLSRSISFLCVFSTLLFLSLSYTSQVRAHLFYIREFYTSIHFYLCDCCVYACGRRHIGMLRTRFQRILYIACDETNP